MDPRPPRFPLLRIMFANATLLSTVYLALALVIELVRRYARHPIADNLSRAVERLPARALDQLGLMAPLGQAYFRGHLSELALRVMLGATTVAIIFAMALIVGVAMWAMRSLFRLRPS